MIQLRKLLKADNKVGICILPVSSTALSERSFVDV